MGVELYMNGSPRYKNGVAKWRLQMVELTVMPDSQHSVGKPFRINPPSAGTHRDKVWWDGVLPALRNLVTLAQSAQFGNLPLDQVQFTGHTDMPIVVWAKPVAPNPEAGSSGRGSFGSGIRGGRGHQA